VRRRHRLGHAEVLSACHERVTTGPWSTCTLLSMRPPRSWASTHPHPYQGPVLRIASQQSARLVRPVPAAIRATRTAPGVTVHVHLGTDVVVAEDPVTTLAGLRRPRNRSTSSSRRRRESRGSSGLTQVQEPMCWTGGSVGWTTGGHQAFIT